MQLELDKEGLITLVKGSQPYYSLMDNDLLVQNTGMYYERMGWRWDINELEKLTEKELYYLYKACRDSWK